VHNRHTGKMRGALMLIDLTEYLALTIDEILSEIESIVEVIS
jgi:hypothetical protein